MLLPLIKEIFSLRLGGFTATSGLVFRVNNLYDWFARKPNQIEPFWFEYAKKSNYRKVVSFANCGSESNMVKLLQSLTGLLFIPVEYHNNNSYVEQKPKF